MKPVLIPPSPPEIQEKPLQSFSIPDFMSWFERKIDSGRDEITQLDLKQFREILDRLNEQGNRSVRSFFSPTQAF